MPRRQQRDRLEVQLAAEFFPVRCPSCGKRLGLFAALITYGRTDERVIVGDWIKGAADVAEVDGSRHELIVRCRGRVRGTAEPCLHVWRGFEEEICRSLIGAPAAGVPLPTGPVTFTGGVTGVFQLRAPDDVPAVLGEPLLDR